MRGERMSCWLAELAYYSYPTTQFSQRVHKATQSSHTERSKVRSTQESCCQQACCTYIFHMICGYRLVVTINGTLSYYYDIQPFSSCPILSDERHITGNGQNKAPGESQRWRPYGGSNSVHFCVFFAWGPNVNFSYWSCFHSGLHVFGLPWLHDPVLTSFTKLDVIAFPCLSMAPSATMIMFSLEPLDRVWGHEHIST